MKSKVYTHRFLAIIVLEAKTPLSIGSGTTNIITDSVILRDVNGLPYIPGTSLAGVIRHQMKIDSDTKSFFGYQRKEDGEGSQIIFSDAKMIGAKGEVIDGLKSQNIFEDDFYSKFKNLPIRQHARIDEKGVASNMGKFDEEIIFKGTRFCFEIKMLSDGDNFQDFTNVLNQLKFTNFRLGGGTRSGFGKVSIVESRSRYVDLNLENEEELNLYLNKTSCLSDNTFWENKFVKKLSGKSNSYEGWTKYILKLSPEDFFLFGSGFGDDDADITPVKEDKIVWNENSGCPKFVEDCILIPATSVKGAISHRVAYHYNRFTGNWADDKNEEELNKLTGKNNKAVKQLFGSEGSIDKDSEMIKDKKRGNIIFSDIIENKESYKDKILNHVAIDRFTGGAIDGALFSEKTTYAKGKSYEMEILVNNEAFKEDDNIRKAFNCTLKDIVDGLLPLGGGVNRGNGAFTGEIVEPKLESKDYE